MKLNIKTTGHADPKLLVQYVKKAFVLFSKDYKAVSEADIKLTFGADKENDKVCEVYLKIQDRNIFVIQKSKSFEQSTLRAIAKLKTQIDNINNTKENDGKIQTNKS